MNTMQDATLEQQRAFVEELRIDYPHYIQALEDRGDIDSLMNAGFIQEAARKGDTPPENVKRKFVRWCKDQLEGYLPQPTPRETVPREPQRVRNQKAVGDLLYSAIQTMYDGFAEEREWLGLSQGPNSREDALQAILRLNEQEISRHKEGAPDFFADPANQRPPQKNRERLDIRYLNDPDYGATWSELHVGPLTQDKRDTRLYVLKGGQLDLLGERAKSIASRYRLTNTLATTRKGPASDLALKFMLTGIAPEYSPCRIEVWEGPQLRGQNFLPLTELPKWVPDQLGRLDRITLIIDPTLSGDAVAKLYEEQRRLLRPAPNAGKRARQDTEIEGWKQDVARFYAIDGYKMDDEALLISWNAMQASAAKPRSFKYAKDLRRVATTAIAHLLDPGRNKD